MPTPLAKGQENSFAPQMIFLGLRPGGWVFNFWRQFRFSMCYPKGAHSLGHRLGTAPRNKGSNTVQIGNIYIRLYQYCWQLFWKFWKDTFIHPQSAHTLTDKSKRRRHAGRTLNFLMSVCLIVCKCSFSSSKTQHACTNANVYDCFTMQSVLWCTFTSPCWSFKASGNLQHLKLLDAAEKEEEETGGK